jgi:hypothetical protein
MATKVNPPPQLRIPPKIFADPELRPYFEAFNTILFQLWKRTGGSSDAVAGKQVAILVGGGDTILDNTAYGALVVIEADSSPVTITLPQPTQDEIGEPIEFVVIDATFNTTIKPQAGTINGQADLAMNRQYQSYPLTSVSITTWVIAGD